MAVSWAPVLGALVAAIIAWVAIAVVALWGKDRLAPGPLRGFGAAALVALALAVLGLPVPWLAPLALLGTGVAASLLVAAQPA